MSQQFLTSTCGHQNGKREATQHSEVSGLGIASRGNMAMLELLHAHAYAEELDRSVWDFAVEITVLHKLGLTNSDLRWLMCKGYLVHGRELTPDEQECRIVRQSNKLKFSRTTCFIATDAGIEFFGRTLGHSANLGNKPVIADLQLRTRGLRGVIDVDADSEEVGNRNGKVALHPVWDRDRQQLRVGSQIVKQFKVPAPNQELILSAFHEEGWPIRIDDPLSPQMDQDPKRRLHDTINSLNRSQKVSLVRFSGDGKGTGVRWELVGPQESAERSRPNRA